jgi:hypothetical protein
MNLWWDLFSVSNNAIDGWFPFTLQALSILIAVAGTWHLTKTRKRPGIRGTGIAALGS